MDQVQWWWSGGGIFHYHRKFQILIEKVANFDELISNIFLQGAGEVYGLVYERVCPTHLFNISYYSNFKVPNTTLETPCTSFDLQLSMGAKMTTNGTVGDVRMGMKKFQFCY